MIGDWNPKIRSAAAVVDWSQIKFGTIGENAMTNHKPEDVEALIDAAKIILLSNPEDDYARRDLSAALAKFAPKPAKVYVLPEYGLSMPAAINAWLSYHTVGQSKWQELRELTATESPAQKWNVPKWVDVPKDSNGWFDFTSENGITNHCGEQAYNAFCAKIMTTNEVKD